MKIDSAYILAARRDNPGASGEGVREAAMRLQEVCRERARQWCAERYAPGTYRELPR
jgi:hypothetical protein